MDQAMRHEESTDEDKERKTLTSATQQITQWLDGMRRMHPTEIKLNLKSEHICVQLSNSQGNITPALRQGLIDQMNQYQKLIADAGSQNKIVKGFTKVVTPQGPLNVPLSSEEIRLISQGAFDMSQARPPAGGIQLSDNPSQFVQQQPSLQGDGGNTMQINTI